MTPQILKKLYPNTQLGAHDLISHTGSSGSDWTHQQLGGPQDVQVQALDPGVVNPHLPVDPGALDANEDSKVGREPGGSCQQEPI